MKDDLINRQKAIDTAIDAADDWDGGCNKQREQVIRGALEALPSAQPEIDYYYCANAMLKMWIDNVLTDGEYNKIMDKLNDFERRRREKENG